MLKQIRNTVKKFHKDESGASAIEYAVMAGLLVVLIVAAVSFLGSSDGTDGITKSFDDMADKMQVE